MEMEPLERAIAVTEGVTEEICNTLGPIAREHINPDRLFARVELHIKNGLSDDVARMEIMSSVIPEIEKSVNERKAEDSTGLSSSKSKSDVLVFKTKVLIKPELESIKCEKEKYLNTQDSAAGGPSTSTVSLQPEVLKQETLDNAAGTSQPSSNPQSVLSHDEIPEISILSPPPRTPAPVIDIIDDSSSSCSHPSSCSSDVVVVGELEHQADGDPNLAGETCAIAKKPLFCPKTHKSLIEFEKALKAVEASNSGCKENRSISLDSNTKLIIDEALSVESNLNEVHQRNEIRVKDDYLENQRLHGKNIELNAPAGVEVPHGALSTPLDKESVIDLKDKAVKQNGDADFFDGDSSDSDDPSDRLWKEAQYICSLLPYFELADVHQSMVDNFYHPERKAHVLEAYIELALDRDEMVPDNVFLSLNAARKRSHEEACGSNYGTGKRIRIEDKEDRPSSDLKKICQSIKNEVFEATEPIPSTSGVVIPSAVANKFHIATPLVPVYSKGHTRTESEREKWCKEKEEFILAVVSHVDIDSLHGLVRACQNDSDVEALLMKLEEEQGNQEVIGTPKVETVNSVPGAFHNHPRANEDDSAIQGNPSEGSAGESEEAPGDIEDRIMGQIADLSEMFNDADPDYLRDRCISINGKQEGFQALVEELVEKKDYPKMEEYLKRQKRLEIKKKFIEGMSVEEFLQYFEDPEKVFCDIEKKMSPTYNDNSKAQLLRDLPFHLSKDIESELRKNNHHYLPTLRALEENKKLGRRKTKRVGPIKESEVADIFIKELCYVRMQVEIKEYLLKKEENKRRAFLWAQSTHQLQECGCCYDDEILEEDMDTCNAVDNKHKFCCTCIRRFAEEEIGQGRTSFRCLEGDCKAEFSLNTLKKVMKPAVFSNILSRKQQEEIAAADIDDLEACPFCNFQTIMPNKEDKVFKCLNPECMKDSCRLCKEPNHVPLRCEEVERQHQKDARTLLENKMTEAMVRECWKCKKRFIKLDGCNKMRCSCGAIMCYICKKAIQGYEHFEDRKIPTNPNKCPLWSNSEKIHAEEVRDAAQKLKEEMDPDIELKHDPTKDLPEVPKNLDRPGQFIPAQIFHGPPPAHQRRLHRRPGVVFMGAPPAHHHPQPAHHYHQPYHDHPPEAHHQNPQPAHQHAPVPVHLLINPGRNDYHHHYHHHHHHHVRHHQGGLRQNAHDLRHQRMNELLEQINEFNEVLWNVQHDHRQQNQQVQLQNQAHLQPQAQPLLLQHPLQNMENLPQEHPHPHPHDHFIGEL